MNKYILRKANSDDMNYINEIYSQAKSFMKTLDIDQWQNGYPNFDSIKNDIANQEIYVATFEGEVVGVMTLSFNIEPTYNVIYDGEWISNDKPYAVIHRIAIANSFHGKGLSNFMFKSAEEIATENNVFNIKIDTHRGNIVMQKALQKNKYLHCGTIQIVTLGDTLRLAYEKVLDFTKI